MKISNLIRLFGIVACAFAPNIALSDIWRPYLMSNADRIEMNEGYCKNAAEEKKFWTAINKFSESFLNEAPQIPPEQKAYMMGEAQSGNSERLHRTIESSMFKMNSLRNSFENLNTLSSDYLKYQKLLSFEKKTEFIGRSLLNLINEKIEYRQLDRFVADLQSKNYYIKSDTLESTFSASYFLREQLVTHLICYSEKSSSKVK
jgi:hypothetical protein